jgi:cysteinyl-tRNA synthetase
VTLQLHNTMARALQPFVPLDPPHVSLYTCGPTVYNYAHIGNFRTFLFEDVLRRWLEASGYAVFHVMNLTDVDDKTIRGAGAAGEPLRAYVERFIAAFFADRDYLRIRPAHEYPRATDYVPQQITLVQSLLDKGVAYRSDDGSVYFAIARFPAYGRLSRLDTRELRTGASGRTAEDEYEKENAQDFVLWKAARPEDEAVGAAWDAPFGRGRPGWHLECSAMALDLVGRTLGRQVLDIHAGGVDLIFPHHEDEIAQSCAHTGEADFARVWLHGEFLTLSGTKMSKRYGNILTARDLAEQGVDPGAVRYLVCSTHYRQRLDWTDDALAAAREGSRGLGELRDRLEAAAAETDDTDFTALVERTWAAFSAAMDDDLSAPRALAALQQFRSEANRLLDAGRRPGPAVLARWRLMDGVLDVCPNRAVRRTFQPADVAAVEAGIAAGTAEAQAIAAAIGGAGAPAGIDQPPAGEARASWAQHHAVARALAKRRRDFQAADAIRAALAAASVQIRDARDGSFEVVVEG